MKTRINLKSLALLTAIFITSAVKSQDATLAPSLSFTTTDVDCFNATTGNIDIIVSGGQAPYTFQWSNGAQTQNIANLAAGTYSVVVTDANGLTHTREISVKQPVEPLQLIISKTDLSSVGANDGTIDVEIVGGTPFKWTPIPYAYTWSNSSEELSQTDLPAGSYTISVEDYKGCTAQKTVKIMMPVASAQVTEAITLLNEDLSGEGKIQSNVYPNPSEGYVNLVYDFKAISEVILIPLNGAGVQRFQTTSTNNIDLSNLNAGYYEVRFMNGNTLVESKKLVVY